MKYKQACLLKKKNKYREILQANHKPWCGLWWWSILFFCFCFVLLTQYLQWYKKNRSFLYLIEKNYSHTHIQGGGPDTCYLIKETHIMTIFCPFYPNWITTAGDCEKKLYLDTVGLLSAELRNYMSSFLFFFLFLPSNQIFDCSIWSHSTL